MVSIGYTIMGEHADVMIAVEPRQELSDWFDQAGGVGRPRIGQVAISYDEDDAVQEFAEAGFTHVALVQIGAEHQRPFFEWAEAELLPALS